MTILGPTHPQTLRQHYITLSIFHEYDNPFCVLRKSHSVEIMVVLWTITIFIHRCTTAWLHCYSKYTDMQNCFTSITSNLTLCYQRHLCAMSVDLPLPALNLLQFTIAHLNLLT